MREKMIRSAQVGGLLAVVFCVVAGAAYGAPPPPPVIAEVPRTPLGGTEITLATAAGIALYGMWKGRR